MSTFHDTTDPLHGVTVVAVTGKAVHVGRCHERDENTILLVDADTHIEEENGKGADGRTNAEFLERVAAYGVWANIPRLALDADRVESLIPLRDYHADSTATPVVESAEPECASSCDSAGIGAQALGDVVATLAPVQAGTLQLTAAAQAEVKRLIEAENKPNVGLRLGVSSGGCSGMKYELEFDEPRSGDEILSFDGIVVLMDGVAAPVLKGVTLDFESGLNGRGFQFKNPRHVLPTNTGAFDGQRQLGMAFAVAVDIVQGGGTAGG